MNTKIVNEKFINAKKIKELSVTTNTTIERNPDIDATSLDDEVVMMNIAKGQYFMMNEVGSRVWEIINEPIKVSSIINRLLEEFKVDNEDCEKTVIDFLNELSYADLIKLC